MITSGKLVQNMSCTWEIIPSHGNTIVLDIDSFQLGGGERCERASLTVEGKNGTSTSSSSPYLPLSSRPILFECGDSPSCTRVVSKSGYMKVTFSYTEACPADDGFSASYKVLSPSQVRVEDAEWLFFSSRMLFATNVPILYLI